jgi:hypothetical protein
VCTGPSTTPPASSGRSHTLTHDQSLYTTICITKRALLIYDLLVPYCSQGGTGTANAYGCSNGCSCASRSAGGNICQSGDNCQSCTTDADCTEAAGGFCSNDAYYFNGNRCGRPGGGCLYSRTCTSTYTPGQSTRRSTAEAMFGWDDMGRAGRVQMAV